MPRATIKKATQKGKRLQAVWTDAKGRERRKAFGAPGTTNIGKGDKKKAFFARHKTPREAIAADQLGAFLAAKDWGKKGGLKPGDTIFIPDKLT